jgi:hypothetical protein
MTPQVKANKIFEEYYQINKNHDFDYAKQCALKLIEELIKFGMFVKQPIIDKSNKVKPNNSQIEYWQQVKKELENL